MSKRQGEAIRSVQRLCAELCTMPKLAASFSPDELAARASGLYEQFRPDISAGSSGCVAADTLDLRKIDSLAHP